MLKVNRIFINVALISFALFSSTISYANENEETLKVLLYPYVPNRLSLFQKIEEQFEKENPGVNLELIDNSELRDNYYSGAIQNSSADVYEVDTILLSEMIQANKASKIDFPKQGFSKETLEAVTREKNTYGVPHWVCGNFLFYKKGDTALEKAQSWDEVKDIITKRNQALFVDFKGKSNLGEWYLTALSQIQGVNQAQKDIINAEPLNQDVLGALNKILATCPDGFCRDNELHDKTGYYSRAFISEKSSAYIGYSESIHYGIQYAIDNCTRTSGCLSINDIAVKKLPPFSKDPKSNGVGWVDALTIDSSLAGKKRELAIKFINFMTLDKTYKTVLEPEFGEAPRYLLPAKNGIEINNAPLYSSFLNAHSGRDTGSQLGLNEKLRDIGKKLDCALEKNRNDSETQKKCQK